MSEPMDVDIQSEPPHHDQPLRSEPETPHADYDEAPPLRRRRALDDQIDKVLDETGEMVRGAFVKFLETYPFPTVSVLRVDLTMNLTHNRLGRPWNRVRLQVLKI
jgi:hypothetical protein